MPSITINGTVIAFPDSGTDPNWAESVIQFAQTVESAFSLVINQYDISPQSFSFANNQSSATNVTNLIFSSAVRGAIVNYHIKRTTTTDLVETGQLLITYNPDASIGNIYTLSQTKNNQGGSSSGVTFTITDGGQIQYTSTNVSPDGSGTIYFRAITFS